MAMPKSGLKDCSAIAHLNSLCIINLNLTDYGSNY